MTPCQERGWKVGDKFRMLQSVMSFTKGEVVTLFIDDGSISPKFKNEAGKTWYVMFYKIEKIEDKPEVTAQEAYQVLQKASGIEVGDTVQITHTAKDYSMGWNNCWTGSMTDKVGQEFIVRRVPEHNTGIGLEGLWEHYPFFVLEIVKKKPQTKEIKIDGKTIEISEESFESLREQLA